MAKRKGKASYPEISISIGTFDRPQVVKKLLYQLVNLSKKLALEVIVIDQSNNVNFRQLKSDFPSLKNFNLIRSENPNLCKSFNLGWKNAKAPVVLFLDDDVEITENTVLAHLEAYKNPNIKGVAGRVINDNEPVTNATEVGKIKYFGAAFLKNFSSRKEGYSDYPYGCNMSFRKETLQTTGGFDEKLVPPICAFNEVDLGYRISKKWPNSIRFIPEALVYHRRYPRGGTRSFSKKELAENVSVNYGYFLAKNFNLFENLIFLARRLPYQILKEPNEIINILTGFIRGKRSRFSRSMVLTIIFFGVIALLNFWRVPEHFFFGIDEEYQSLLALSLIRDFHPIWIGLSAANTGFYVGPGLVYLHALLLWLSELDPISLAYAASITGFLTIIAFYKIIKHLFSKKIAFISTVFYSLSPFTLYYNRRFWNSTFVPLISILFFLGLYKSGRDSRWYIFIAVLLGVSFHIHASLFFWIPVILVVLFYRGIRSGFKINLKITLISAVLFLIIYSPLIVYDLVHNFDNLKTPIRLLQSKQGLKFLDYYLLGFLPYFALMLGLALSKLNYKLIAIITGILVLTAAATILSCPTNDGLTAKKQLITKTISYLGDRSFYLETNQNYIYFGGWRYLFEAYGKKPDSSQADEMFGWIYNQENTLKKPDLKVIIATDSVGPQKRVLKKITSGIYNAYIVVNQ